MKIMIANQRLAREDQRHFRPSMFSYQRGPEFMAILVFMQFTILISKRTIKGKLPQFWFSET